MEEEGGGEEEGEKRRLRLKILWKFGFLDRICMRVWLWRKPGKEGIYGALTMVIKSYFQRLKFHLVWTR